MNSPSSAGSTPAPSSNAGGCSIAPKPRFASVTLFCFKAVAYRLQERVLGGLKSSTRRLLERAAEDKVDRRPPTEAPATRVTPGTVLIREWHGVSHRVTVLADGVLLRGARYRSLSEVARKITGTRWSGPRFFGLRAPAKRSDHGTR